MESSVFMRSAECFYSFYITGDTHNREEETNYPAAIVFCNFKCNSNLLFVQKPQNAYAF